MKATSHKWNVRGPTLLAISLGASQAIALGRTIIVADILGPEIRGEGVIISVIAGFFGTLFALNAGWQLVQSERFDDPEFQSSLHGTSILRGVAVSTCLAFVSMAVLNTLDQASLIGPMLLAACIPAVDGLTHYDGWRLLRHQSYRTLAAIEFAGPIVGTVATVVALSLTRSVWVLSLTMLAVTAGRVTASHLFARRRYHAKIYRAHVNPILRYSIPLVPGGLFFWINSQSDQIVIMLSERSAWMESFNLAELGAYGTMAAIVLAPQSLAVKLTQPIVTARIAESKSDTAMLVRTWVGIFRIQAVLSALIASIGSAIAVLALHWALNDGFDTGIAVVPVLIGAMSIRLMRILFYTCSAALNSTSIVAFGNAVRLAGLPLALAASGLHLGLAGLAWSVLVAEALTLVACGLWMRKIISNSIIELLILSLAVAAEAAGMQWALSG